MISSNVLVAICIVTYNQEDYIAKALDSVIRQKTEYKFKIFIGEDCSTDNTRKICVAYKEKYPELIELILSQNNLGLVKNTSQVMSAIMKQNINYIAMLDGDDYWCDDNKIQLQCEFLENNLEYGLTFTRSATLRNNKLYVRKISESIDGFIPLNKAKYFPLSNNTVMFRVALLNYISFAEFIRRGFMSCDYAMYVIFAYYTKFKSFPTVTAVCRRDHSSISNPKEIEKKIKYVDNDIAQFRYLGDRFQNVIPFTEKDEQNHRDFMVYSIAVKYGRYDLVKETLHKNENVKKYKRGKLYKLKIFFSSNRFFFNIWTNLSRFLKNNQFK